MKVYNWKWSSVIKSIQAWRSRKKEYSTLVPDGNWQWHFWVCEAYRIEHCQKGCNKIQNDDQEDDESKFIEKLPTNKEIENVMKILKWSTQCHSDNIKK